MDLKLAWRNIARKKILYILLWLTIALSALTILLTLTFREAAVDLRLEQLRADTLNTQLSILTKSEDKIHFPLSDLGKAAEHPNVKHRIPRLVAGGMLREKPVTLMGLDLPAQAEALPFRIVSQSETRFVTDGALVSQAFSKAHNLSPDSAIRVETEKGVLEATVHAVCEDTGIFSDENLVIVPIDTLQKLYGKDLVTSVGLTLTDLSQVEKTTVAVAGKLPDTLFVEQRYDVSGYQAYVGTVELALSVFSFFSITMSLLMTISISRRILEERRLQIGVQRSLGTSAARLFVQVLAENLLVLLLAVVTAVLLYSPAMNAIFALIGMPGAFVSPGLPALLITAGGFVLIGLVSVWLSLRAILGHSIVTLLKGADEGLLKGNGLLRTGTGIFLLALSVILYRLDVEMILTAAGMALFLFAVITLLPVLYRISLAVLVQTAGRIRPLRMPLVEMQRRYTDYAQSILLLVLLLCVLSVSLQLAQVIRNNVASVYGDTDVLVHTYEKGMEEKLRDDKDLKTLIRQERYITRYNDRKLELAGIETDTYRTIAFENSDIGFDRSLERLKAAPDGILITTTLAKNNDLQPGDTLDLKEYGSYTVTGLISSLEMSGDVQFVNIERIRALQLPDKEYRYFLKYTGGVDPDEKAKELNDRHAGIPFSASSLESIRREDAKSTGQIFAMIYALFGLTFVIGLLTLINNLFVSISRQKTPIAVRRSLGLSRRRFVGEQALTGLALGVSGGVLGLLTGTGMAYFVARVMNYFIGAITVTIQWPMLGLILAGTALLCLLATVLPGAQIAGLPVIESIKGKNL